MQPENFNNIFFCKLCMNIISCTNSKVIEKAVREALEVILPTLNLEETHKHMVCEACCSKLFAAFNFKKTCMNTEASIFPYTNAGKVSVVELKKLYLKVNGIIELTDMQENQKICRLCLQRVTYGVVSLNEVDSDIINTYIPEVNINVTKNPIVCEPCYNSLNIHGGFVMSSLKAQEKYISVDNQPYIKSEVADIKLEDGHETQEEYKSLDEQFYIKPEEIEIKTEEGYQDSDSISHNLKKETIVNKRCKSEDIVEIKNEYMVECETKVQINKCETPLDVTSHKNRYKRMFEGELGHEIDQHQKYPSEIEMYNCDTCTDTITYRCHVCYYETKSESDMKYHLLTHKDSSEIKMYKCDFCIYETKHKKSLNIHQLIHKDPSEVLMYKCDTCSFETKRKNALKLHHLTHKDPSEIQMYGCDVCDYETKRKSDLKYHELTHKDPSEIKMYRCDACGFETKRKEVLKCHQLTHKDPSEIKMYKCDVCHYETIYKGNLKSHQLIHKSPSEIHMYKCDTCTYQTKYKKHLKTHQLTHKLPSETQIYKCDECHYKANRKGNLKEHQLTHKDPSEIQMYKCDMCYYEAKRKSELKRHQITHKDPSEIQMYKCDACTYNTKHRRNLRSHQLTHKDPSA